MPPSTDNAFAEHLGHLAGLAGPRIVQDSLWANPTGQTPAYGPVGAGLTRHQLDARSWIDVRPGWLAGDQDLFDALYAGVPWRAERRQMYDQVVAVPRLTAFYGPADPLPHPLLVTARDLLNAHYAAELGEPFVTAGLCLYRDGADSVAFHGDRIGRGRDTDTMVAILALGQPRALAFRPRDGGPTVFRRPLGHGDLAVMGGACQRDFDHGIAKTNRGVGPRISVQFRVAGVR